VTTVYDCQALCNTTAKCVTVTIDHTNKSCTLLSSAGPGTGDPSCNTYVLLTPELLLAVKSPPRYCFQCLQVRSGPLSSN
jgi:hypothetical protein